MAHNVSSDLSSGPQIHNLKEAPQSANIYQIHLYINFSHLQIHFTFLPSLPNLPIIFAPIPAPEGKYLFFLVFFELFVDQFTMQALN